MPLDPKKQLPKGIKTANDEFFDALIRHQIGLLRFDKGLRTKILKLLDATEQDIADRTRLRLRGHTGITTPAALKRANTLIKSLKTTRAAAWKEVETLWSEELRALAQAETAFVAGALKTVVPVVVNTRLPSEALLRSIVTSRPFQGNTLKEWASGVRAADIRRIEEQIKIGMVQGESSDDIARRIVGTARLRGTNGVTEITRRNAAAITRTVINGVAGQARREFYQANPKLFDEELYVATLDSRTTPICQSLDGSRFPLGEGPYPPVHIACRSLRVAILDDKVIGSRPSKPVTDEGLLREFTKREGLKQTATRAGLPRGTKGRFDAFSRTRKRELIGQVPAKVTYQQWLGRQSAAFQDDVLGKTRGRLFRRGGLELDRFVDQSGRQLSLRELAVSDKSAFKAAGLKPEEFL